VTSASGLSLRPATLSDVASIERLIERSVRALSDGHYTIEQIESALRFMFGVDSRLVEQGTYFVVETADGIVAAGGWSRWKTLFGGDRFKDVEDEPLRPGRDAARIRAFFVHPDWARRGFARLLFDRCLREARASGFHALELMATLPGEPLYRSLGFVADERIQLTLADGVSLPLVRMSRPIDLADV
jgi:GNAT superfamily N-acetyltransferase